MSKNHYEDFGSSSNMPASRDSEYIEASELLERAKKKKHKPSNHQGSNNMQYGISKKPGKKLNYKQLRVIFSACAALLGLILGIVFFGIWYKEYLLGKITYEDSDANAVITIVDEEGNTIELDKSMDRSKNDLFEDQNIKNFLLIGIDSRSKTYSKSGKGDRSDCIVVMSINTKEGTIKLMSIARDSYAYFPGYKAPHKINAAMSYGGAPLLQAAVEDNLRIKIDGYAYVNFNHMAEIVDAVGGVYVDVTEKEKNIANQYVREMDPNAAQIENTGKNTWLNGVQAVGYARNRYSGNGDYERMERQIEVLRSVMAQYMKLSGTRKLAAMDDVLGAIKTNIPKKDIEKYAFDFLPKLKKAEMQYMQLPIEGCYNYGTYGGEWSMRVNWNAFIPYVQEYFYGKKTDFEEVKLPSHAPELSKCKTNIPLEKLVH